MKTAVGLLLVSTMIGALAALAAVAICSLTSAALSPAGGAVLGMVFGVSAANMAVRPHGRGAPIGFAVASGLLGAGAAAGVVVLFQR